MQRDSDDDMESSFVNDAICTTGMEKKRENKEMRSSQESINNMEDEDEMKIQCGVGSWRPTWLQKFAKAEVYAIAYALLGFVICADSTYFVGTLSTVEKYFKLPSRMTGFMHSSFEIGSLVAMPIVGYAARHLNPMRLVFSGTALTGFACLCFALPHFIFGSESDVVSCEEVVGSSRFGNATETTKLTWQEKAPLEGVTSNCDHDSGSSSWPIILFCAANVLVGIGTAAHYTVGYAYLDNNCSKNKSPILLAVTASVQMFGATLGYAVSAMALSLFVEPTLSPSFDSHDPRWIGAWWLGWPLMGTLTAAVGFLLLLFPQRLPQKAQRRTADSEGDASTSLAQDLKHTIWRLLTNKVLVFNTCSTICLFFGYSGYWTFLPKYMEVQFQKPASEANIITGSMNLVFSGTGTLAAAVIITRFKPGPRKIAAWNVLTELTDILAHFSWAFLGCSTSDIYGVVDSSGNFAASCNSSIVCGSNPQIEPVCSVETTTTFYSPCFAGCNIFDNETKTFSDCACIPNGVASSGLCNIDCRSPFMVFIILQCLLRFLHASGSSGNMLLAFRCVDEKDKSLSIALTQIVLSILVFFPAPAVYGALLDSTCLFWRKSDGTGNCWLYDKEKMRYLLNFTATGFLIIGLIFDIAVWIYCSGLKVYEEELNSCPKESSSSDNANKDYME